MRAARRGTAWDDTLPNVSVADGAFGSLLLIDNTADPEKRGCTLVRLILDFDIFPATPGAVSGRQNFAMGIAVVSDDAFTSGASGMPNPEVNTDYPVAGWLWRKRVAIFDETLATGPVPLTHVREDLRSMRKLDRSSVALLMFNGTGEGTAFNVTIMGTIRALYKLP